MTKESRQVRCIELVTEMGSRCWYLNDGTYRHIGTLDYQISSLSSQENNLPYIEDMKQKQGSDNSCISPAHPIVIILPKPTVKGVTRSEITHQCLGFHFPISQYPLPMCIGLHTQWERWVVQETSYFLESLLRNGRGDYVSMAQDWVEVRTESRLRVRRLLTLCYTSVFPPVRNYRPKPSRALTSSPSAQPDPISVGFFTARSRLTYKDNCIRERLA